jgi:hypothetical protein
MFHFYDEIGDIMDGIYMPQNFTILMPNEVNTSMITESFKNETFLYNVPIKFLHTAMGDFYPLYIYSLVMIAVAVKFKNPMPIAFASLLTALVLIPVSPDVCRYALMFICAISIVASTYLFIKQ